MTLLVLAKRSVEPTVREIWFGSGAPPRTKIEPSPAITGDYKRLGGDLQVSPKLDGKTFKWEPLIVDAKVCA